MVSTADASPYFEMWALPGDAAATVVRSTPYVASTLKAGVWQHIVGCDGAGQGCFQGGTVDELAFYDHLLSDAQVKTHFQLGSGLFGAP